MRVLHTLDAIEDQAAAAERARIAALVRGLYGTNVLDGRGVGMIHEPTRAAVLAAIEGESK